MVIMQSIEYGDSKKEGDINGLLIAKSEEMEKRHGRSKIGFRRSNAVMGRFSDHWSMSSAICRKS